MCIAIPALVKSIHGYEAVAEIGGRERQINVFFTPEVKVGDYVLLDSGYSMEVISEAEAFEIFEFLEQVSEAGDEEHEI